MFLTCGRQLNKIRRRGQLALVGCQLPLLQPAAPVRVCVQPQLPGAGRVHLVVLQPLELQPSWLEAKSVKEGCVPQKFVIVSVGERWRMRMCHLPLCNVC